MKQYDKNEINRFKSLIYLLDDEDDSNHSLAKRTPAFSWRTRFACVRGVFRKTDDSLMQQRIREIYELISLSAFKDQLRSFCEKHKSKLDLEEGAL